jgi:hypothetical protein
MENSKRPTEASLLLATNPFPEDHACHQPWVDALRSVKERGALFLSGRLNVIPEEAAPASEFIKWKAETLAGLFDIWAQVVSGFCPRTNAGAELFEELLVGFEGHLQSMAMNSLPHGRLIPKAQMSEIGIALKGRRLYWVGRMLGSVHQHEDALRSLQWTTTTNHRANQDSGAAAWDSIKISFLNDHKVQIFRNGLPGEPMGYSELGFEDRRSGKPDQAWATLRALAEERGILRDGASAGAEWLKVEKHMQKIRKVFRDHFHIPGDPIPFIVGTGYRALFEID